MFKKLRITGLNKIKNIVAGVLAAAIFMGIPVSAAKPDDFADLKENQSEWYYGEVSKAIELGLFGGQSETYFGVDEEITRAEFVTALSRLCGADVQAYSHNGHFIDVLEKDWHYSYVSWAFKEGLVGGTSENEFSPDRPVNRQEMSKMLANAIELVFKKTLTTEGAATFTDQAQIDAWAVPYVQKCNVAKIFYGDENGNFSPLQVAPRHQAACVFYRCHSMLEAEKPPVEEEKPAEPPAGGENPPAGGENPPAEEETPPVEEKPAEYALTVSGFDLDFKVDQDYYLVHPADFKKCKIVGYKGFTDFKVNVECYAGYKYSDYKVGEFLELRNGRAKVVIEATLKNGEKREYLIALTDPNAADYSYSKVKVNTQTKLYEKPDSGSKVLHTFFRNSTAYYLKTEGEWCLVEQVVTNGVATKVGYVSRSTLQWNWKETGMPDRYKAAVEALQKAHPAWHFTFAEIDLDYNTYLQQTIRKRAETAAEAAGYAGNEEKILEYVAQYTPEAKTYMDPLYYLAEDRIFAMLNIDIYDEQTWTEEGIAAIWKNEDALKKQPNAISKADAVKYIKAASESILMNPYYIACRAAQESGYGASKFAMGTISGYEGYHNFYGIQCVDSNPSKGAAYAKNRNWNSPFRAIVEGANWVKDQYLDRSAITPYFFRYARFWNTETSYMSDLQAPIKEASILKRAFTDPNAKAHFVIPVYRNMPTE